MSAPPSPSGIRTRETADGTVTYTELVPEIASEPDYDAALGAAR